MGIDGCQELIELYSDWLKKNISVQDKDGVCEITTPFLDRHNDYVQIYVKKVAQTSPFRTMVISLTTSN